MCATAAVQTVELSLVHGTDKSPTWCGPNTPVIDAKNVHVTNNGELIVSIFGLIYAVALVKRCASLEVW
jgi:hypothetical protein